VAQAVYCPPRPVPVPPPYPAPYPAPAPYPYPYYQVTCYTQGLWNGVVFYGTGPNIYVANQNAAFACQSTGQACQYLGCQ
jgi:hypothetical protein